MAISITCECGSIYNLKDEFAGKKMKCPKCQQTIVVPLGPASSGDAAFDQDKYLLNQKMFTVAKQKYYVQDQQGQNLLYIERPAHLLQSAGAAIVMLFFVLLALAASIVGGLALHSGMHVHEAIVVPIAVLVLVGVIGVGLLLMRLIAPKRHVHIMRDDQSREAVLDIIQEQKLVFIHAFYTLKTPDGATLARFHKNYLYNMFRKQWDVLSPDGAVLCQAKEDSVVLSLLRRLMGSFYGLLRTNFIIVKPGTEDLLGEFNRKFTLHDRYVLDLSHDPQRTLDRRMALALGLLLDTGEGR